MKIMTSLLLIELMLTGCANAGQDQESARLVWVNFFERLSSAQYGDAGAPFDGDIFVFTFEPNNPDSSLSVRGPWCGTIKDPANI